MEGVKYSKGQLNVLVILRLLIGWHFFYEGCIKLFNPAWTAQGYLMGATGPFNKIFQMLAGESLIGVVDSLNMAALIIVGLGLILGFWTRLSAILGIALLALYYLSYPPFPWLDQIGPAEGTYLFINKNLIEMMALFVLLKFPTAQYFGLESILNKKLKTA